MATTELDDKKKRRRNKVPTTLTIEQKLDIVSTELEEVTKDRAESKVASEKLIDTLRAVLEETDIRIAELKKEAYEFKRDIVVGAENMRTGKTMAEKVVRYMEDKLRQREAMIEKLRLKNATLKTAKQKVEAQLRQKEEMGDVLHYIDFHQLQIENKQYVQRIDERNEELLKLKLTTVSTVQALNTLKNKLQSLLTESSWLTKEIKSRTDQLKKLEEDAASVQAELQSEARLKKKLAHEDSDQGSGMPQILDYVKQKKDMYEMEATLRNWERKVEIAEMAAKKAKATMKRSMSAGKQG
jgi:chromosome segregation ATPase